MNQLDEEADESHKKESHGDRLRDFNELCVA
jgi:hypothetical protein